MNDDAAMHVAMVRGTDRLILLLFKLLFSHAEFDST
jgi:hypothetical protein